MKTRRVLAHCFPIVFLLLACFGPRIEAKATYNFVGVPFTTYRSLACPANCEISGSFTVPQSLEPNITGAGAITPSSFSFTDGRTTITDTNASASSFAANTDANGNITQYAFSMASGGVSFNVVYAGSSGSTSEIDTYTNFGYGGTFQGMGLSAGTWCLSFPTGSTEISPNPCYLANPVPNFGGVEPGSSSPQQGVMVVNPGTTPLVISDIAIGPDYKETNNCSTVAPGGNCTIYVTFSPTTSFVPTETLTITDNGVNSPQTAYLNGSSADVNGASVSIVSSLNPSALGQSVTFTATVSNTSPLTGKFEFFDNNGETSLGSSAVNTDGTATFTTSTLTAGTHSIFADYFAPDGSSVGELPLQQVVTSAPPAFTLGASPATATITAGGSATFTLTVTPQNGFNSPVSFGCEMLPAESACTFSPGSITPGSGAATVTMNLSTTAPTLSSNRIPTRPSGFGPAEKALSGLLLAALLWLAPRRSRGYRWMTLLVAGVLSTILFSGCGAIKNLINQNTDPGTPKGSATVQIFAISGSGSSVITETANVTVTVQ